MIARTWRGWTRAEDTQAYADYIRETGLAEYVATPGNRGAHLLHRPDCDGRTEFVTISFWQDLAAIEGFAGEDISRAKFYPDDDRYLVDRETVVHHYQVTQPPH